VQQAFPAGETIGAGETYTYKLKGTPALFGKDGTTLIADSISFYLEEDAAYVASATSGATAIAAKNFVWSDVSALNHSVSTADWTGGYKVGDLPLDADSWSY